MTPTLRLNDGRQIPQLGFGTWQIDDREAPETVGRALATGYRLIDTAAAYDNETGVGAAIRASGVPRDEVFVTTKVWNDAQGFDAARRACEESLTRLGLDAVDLLLIHWPAPRQDRYVDTWRALIRLKEEGRARSIGVSNFLPAHLERIVRETGVTPALNQIELHPRFQQAALRKVHAEREIVTESWSPLGRGGILDAPAIVAAAKKHGRTPAQIALRWHLDSGLVTIPKSSNPARIAENFAILDFRLDADDLKAIAGLDDRGGRIGPDPAVFG